MDRFSLIEKYFEETLSASERIEFEELLNIDTEFKKEFDFQSNLQKAIRNEKKIELKKELQELEKKSFNNKARGGSYFLRIAASILVLVSVGGYFLLNSSSASPDDLFNDYYTPYRNVIHPIVRGESSENLEFKAFLNYENKEYSKSLELLDSLYEQSEKSHLLLYQSNCLLSLNKTEEATILLKEYLLKEDAFKDKAYWYLGLAYLKLNDTKEAKKYFELLQELGSFKKKGTAKILKQL